MLKNGFYDIKSWFINNESTVKNDDMEREALRLKEEQKEKGGSQATALAGLVDHRPKDVDDTGTDTRGSLFRGMDDEEPEEEIKKPGKGMAIFKKILKWLGITILVLVILLIIILLI